MGRWLVSIQAVLLFCASFQGTVDKHPELVSDALSSALKNSRLGLSGHTPFHLKAVVKDPEHKNPAYEATIEEFWVSPEKWRRTVRSRDFSTTTVVNGQDVFQQSEGGYYPSWLRNTVTAIFDVVPDDFTPAQKTINTANLNRATDHAAINGAIQTTAATTCTGWNEEGGPPPNPDGVSTSVCFNHLRVLNSLRSPYFTSHYMEPSDFDGEQVARRIRVFLNPPLSIEASVNELSKLHNVDDSMFVIDHPTAERERFYSLRLRKDDALNLLLNSAEIAWKPVADGKTSGMVSLVAFVDSQGQIRETRALYSDNQFATEQVENALKAWRFKPLLRDGVPVQMETLLTFNFTTTSENTVPILSDAEARKQASNKSDTLVTSTGKARGTEFKVRAYVNELGRITRIENTFGVDAGFFEIAKVTLASWQFKQYKVDGKPRPFDADIVFHVKYK